MANLLGYIAGGAAKGFGEGKAADIRAQRDEIKERLRREFATSEREADGRLDAVLRRQELQGGDERVDGLGAADREQGQVQTRRAGGHRDGVLGAHVFREVLLEALDSRARGDPARAQHLIYFADFVLADRGPRKGQKVVRHVANVRGFRFVHVDARSRRDRVFEGWLLWFGNVRRS